MISLASNSVAVSFPAGRYTQWSEFRGELVKAQEALQVVYKPAFYSRIGLRYRDIIDKDALGLGTTEWRDLIKPEFIGLLGQPDLAASVHNLKTEMVLGIDEVEGARATLRHGLMEHKTQGDSTTKAYSFDIDFFVQGRTGAHDVTGTLDVFNRVAGNFFRWAITPLLHNALQPTPIRT